MLTREELTKRISKLIFDVGLRWKEDSDTAPPIEFIKSTALLIVSEVICYQSEKNVEDINREEIAC